MQKRLWKIEERFGNLPWQKNFTSVYTTEAQTWTTWILIDLSQNCHYFISRILLLIEIFNYIISKVRPPPRNCWLSLWTSSLYNISTCYSKTYIYYFISRFRHFFLKLSTVFAIFVGPRSLFQGFKIEISKYGRTYHKYSTVVSKFRFILEIFTNIYFKLRKHSRLYNFYIRNSTCYLKR